MTMSQLRCGDEQVIIIM